MIKFSSYFKEDQLRFLQYLFFAVLLQSAFSQDPLRVRSLSTLDGLSQNSVTQILEDQDGYIWLGTQDGLNRYNGYNFRVFRPDPDDPFSLGDNFIIQMILGPDGRLWLSTREGLSVYEKGTDRFYKIITSPENPFRSFYQMQQLDGRIYLSYYSDRSSIWSVDIHQKFEKPYTLLDTVGRLEHIPIEQPLTFMETSDGASYFFGLSEGIRLPEGQKFSIPDSLVFSFSSETWQSMDIGGNQVLVAHPKKLLSVHTDLSPKIEVVHDSIGVYSFLGFESGFALATNQGLKFLNPRTRSITDLEVEGQNFQTSIIHHLFRDSFGQMWIGTANQGVFIHQPLSRAFNYLNETSSEKQLVTWDATRIGETWYLGTDNGLWVFQNGQLVHHMLSDKKITASVSDDTHNLWIGTQKGELYLLSSDSRSVQKVYKPGSMPITSLLPTDTGLYVASQGGLSLFTGGSFTKIESQVIKHPGYYLFELYEDNSGVVWIGSANGCHYIKRSGQISSIPYKKGSPKSMNFNFVSGFAEDKTGIMWVATYGGGLSRLNPDSTFTHFTEKDGLSNNVIHAICADDQGFLWLTSNGGLTRFDPVSQESVNFTTMDGLKSHNFAVSAIVKSDSMIAIGSTNGLLLFSPSNIHPLRSPPRILWEDIRINYNPIPVSQQVNSLHEVRLNPGDKVISVELSGIKLDHPTDVQYTHQLEGFSAAWVPLPQGSRIISYSSLPYGTYQLRVRASSKNHHFPPSERVLTIHVATPFWFNWWFIALVQVLIVLLIVGAVFYFSRRTLKRRLRELETEAKIQAERHRISQDLHDSVGTHFAYIISKLDYLFLSWGKDEVIQDKKSYLHSLSDFARSGMRLLRETIWALDASHVSSLSLKSKIGDYLKFCLTDSNLRYTFVFSSTQENILSPDALHCFRIIQEAVSNSLRHACAKNLSVSVSIHSTGFEIVIQDDGKGFDPDVTKTGETYGMKSMKKRCEELGASLEIKCVAGTTIRVVKESPK